MEISTLLENARTACGDAVRRLPNEPVDLYVQRLAKHHEVHYAETGCDRLAVILTQLAGDDVQSDPIKDLLRALIGAGKISDRDFCALLVEYLRVPG